MKPIDCFATHMNNFRVIPRIVILWLLHTTWHLADWVTKLNRNLDVNDVALVGLFTGLFVLCFRFGFDNASDVKPTGDYGGTGREDHPAEPQQ